MRSHVKCSHRGRLRRDPLVVCDLVDLAFVGTRIRHEVYHVFGAVHVVCVRDRIIAGAEENQSHENDWMESDFM